MSFGTVVSIVCVHANAVCSGDDRVVSLLRLIVVIVGVLRVQNAMAVVLAVGDLQLVQLPPQLLPLLLLLFFSEDARMRTLTNCSPSFLS